MIGSGIAMTKYLLALALVAALGGVAQAKEQTYLCSMTDDQGFQTDIVVGINTQTHVASWHRGEHNVNNVQKAKFRTYIKDSKLTQIEFDDYVFVADKDGITLGRRNAAHTNFDWTIPCQ
jgi:hypothetical protein